MPTQHTDQLPQTDRVMRAYRPGRDVPESVPANSLLVPFWDIRPLASDSWGNILGLDDGSGDGDAVDMRLWRRATPDATHELPTYRPAHMPLPPCFRSGGVRRCYRPTDADIAAVRAMYPSHPNPEAPPWQRIAADLVAAGCDRDRLADLNPPALLQLLVQARERQSADAVSVGDQPDERGYVESPADPAEYVPAIDILTKFTPPDLPMTMYRLVTILEDYSANRVRWTRPLNPKGQPMQRRRSVHLVDWAAYVKRHMPDDEDKFPRLSEAELERRKAAVRASRYAPE